MLRISQAQEAALSTDYRHAFILQTVADWLALRELADGVPPSTSFDRTWDIVDDLMSEVANALYPPEQGTIIHLCMTVLNQVERGVPPTVLEAAVAAYLRVLPSDEAGLILLEFLCDVEALTTLAT